MTTDAIGGNEQIAQPKNDARFPTWPRGGRRVERRLTRSRRRGRPFVRNWSVVRTSQHLYPNLDYSQPRLSGGQRMRGR